MPNSKISALTSATTPLAGTEVLPIVQSSTTKQVSIADVTAGRAVSALSLTATNLKTSPAAANLDISGTTIAASGSNTNISISITAKGTGVTALNAAHVGGGTAYSNTKLGVGNNTGAPSSWAMVSTENCGGIAPPSSVGFNLGWNYSNGGGETTFVYGTTAGGSPGLTINSYNGVSLVQTVKFDASNNLRVTTNNIIFETSNRGILDANGNESLMFTATASAVNELTIANAATGNRPTISATGGDTNIGINLTPKGTGDVRVTTGNLVMATAGKGIDFSANSHAAGMTSELLTWYEEGTFTPASGVGAATSNAGKYTRIGNAVHITGSLTFPVQTNSSNAVITGLPFTSGSSSKGGCLVRYSNFTSGGFYVYIDDSNTTMGLYGLSGSALTYTQFSGVRVDFVGFYFV